MVVVISKEDFGTEQRAIQATLRVEKHAQVTFEGSIDDWWRRVKTTAQMLCRQMGAYETGTLHDTIRILFQAPTGQFFEVVAGPSDIRVDRMLVAGGWLINPKTGEICDYAQIVHDGGPTSWGYGYIAGRPFMTMALDMMEPELRAIMNKFMDGQANAWSRD